MTILVITDRLPWPLNSGASIRTYFLLKGLCRFNDVHCLIVEQDSSGAGKGKPLSATPERLDKVIPEGFKNIPIKLWKSSLPPIWGRKTPLMAYALNTLSSLPWMIAQFYSTEVQHHCLYLIEKFGITTIQAELLGMGQYLQPLNGVNRIYGSHNVESDLLRQRINWSRSPLVKLHCYKEFLRVRRYESRLITQVDLTTTVTTDDRNRLKMMSPGKQIEFFPITIDPSLWQPAKEPASATTLVFLGTMFWYPNVDGILWFYHYILPHIRSEIPDVHLKIIGRDPVQSVFDLTRDPMVEVTGTVENISDHLFNGDILIVPLRMGGGMRVKILEALARGLPVVSTTLGCEGMSLVPDESILCADDPLNFARACLELIRDPHKRKKIIQAGKDAVFRDYHWENQQKRLENIYRNFNN